VYYAYYTWIIQERHSTAGILLVELYIGKPLFAQSEGWSIVYLIQFPVDINFYSRLKIIISISTRLCFRHHKIFKKSNNINFNQVFRNIIFIYHTKCIPYEDGHPEDSNDINLVF
jgi:hypothetical protein